MHTRGLAMALADTFLDEKIVEAIARALRESATQGGRMVQVPGLGKIMVSSWGEVKDLDDVMNGACRAGKIEPSAYTISWTRPTKGELEVPTNPELAE